MPQALTWNKLGDDNLEVATDADGHVLLRFNPSLTVGMSSSGKNMLVSTSRGEKAVATPNGKQLRISINVY